MNLVRRNVALLWVAQLVSQIGDAVHATAVIFLVLLLVPEAEGASSKAGLVAFLEAVPFLLVGFIAGGMADRFDRRRVLMASDLARALLLVVMVPLLVWADALSWWSLGVLSFLLGLASTPFNPARDALVPSLVGGVGLLRVAAILQSSHQVAMILGTMLAGSYIYFRSDVTQVRALSELLFLNGLTFVVSLVLISRLRIARRHGLDAQPAPFLAELRAALRRVAADPPLRWLLLLTAVNNLFLMGPAIVGANLYIKHTLGLGAAELAWFECALAVGWLLGTFMLWNWGDRFDRWHLLFVGMIVDGLTYVPFLWITNYDVALVTIFFHGMAIPFIAGVRTTIIQERVAGAQLGRVFSLVNLTVVGFTSLSLFLTGVAGDALPAPTLFLIGGVGGAASGLAGWILLCAFRGRFAKDGDLGL